jgi:hypothetical protein
MKLLHNLKKLFIKIASERNVFGFKLLYTQAEESNFVTHIITIWLQLWTEIHRFYY